MPAGGSSLTTPSTSTQVPRISRTCPATVTVRDCSSGSSSVMCRASAPSRIRSGADVGTPSRTRGRAVTGPTHIACTSVRSADEHLVLDAHLDGSHQHRGHGGRRREADGVELALGDAARRAASKAPSRGTGCQRYTRIGTTSAPAARSSSRNSGNGSQSAVAPCSWTAIRSPSMPPSRRYCSTSREDSDSGDHSSGSPAARSAPVALGPRETMRALLSARDQVGGQSPAVGGGDPAAQPDAGGRDDDVGWRGDQRLGVVVQFVVVGQRHHLDRGGAGHGRAASAQQRAQLVGASG